MPITFHPLCPENLKEAFGLNITEDQRSESQLGTVDEIIEKMCAIEEIQQNVIYDDALPIGYIAFRVFPGDGKSGGIDRFFIDHQYQAKGYGTAALQLALKILCDDLGCETVQLNYMHFALNTASFYEKLGFVAEPPNNMGEVKAVYTNKKSN